MFTDEGQRTVDQYLPAIHRAITHAIAPLTEPERRQLLAALVKVRGGVAGWQPRTPRRRGLAESAAPPDEEASHRPSDCPLRSAPPRREQPRRRPQALTPPSPMSPSRMTSKRGSGLSRSQSS